MKLSLLAAELGLKALPEDKDITFITDNSAKVCDGSIFVCIEGKHFDGHTKAAEALENGAAAVVVNEILAYENEDLAIALGVKQAPTLVVVKDGEAVKYAGVAEIKKFIEASK